MTSALRSARLERICTPADLLNHLRRTLQRCREARTTTDALDGALAFATATSAMTAWLWSTTQISRDKVLRRRILRDVGSGLPNLDEELLAAILSDLNPNVSVCEEIAADPRCIRARITASGSCELLIMRDGEATVLPIERFVDVEVFFREFVKRYLADAPTLPRAA